MVDRDLELGVDSRRAQDRLQLLGLGHVAGHRHLHQSRHSRALLAGSHGLGLAASCERAALHELRPTSLLEADVDRIEVLRNDRVREDRPRLARDLAAEVAVREVRQGEQPDARPRERHRPPRARSSAASPSRARARPRRTWPRGRGRPRPAAASITDSEGPPSPAITTLRPGRAAAEHLVGRDRRAVRERHRLAALQRAPLRSWRNAERVGRLDVEASWPRVLDERVADSARRRERPRTSPSGSRRGSARRPAAAPSARPCTSAVRRCAAVRRTGRAAPAGP